MSFSRSTYLLMLMSLETLISIITTGLPIMMELIDPVNSVIIILGWLTFLLGSLTVILTVLPALLNVFHSSDASICSTMVFPPIGKLWSCCCLIFYWLSILFTTGCPPSSHTLLTILVVIGTVFIIIRAMLHNRISLNSVLLTLLVNFVSKFRLELIYIYIYPSSKVSDQATLMSMVFSGLWCCHHSSYKSVKHQQSNIKLYMPLASYQLSKIFSSILGFPYSLFWSAKYCWLLWFLYCFVLYHYLATI